MQSWIDARRNSELKEAITSRVIELKKHGFSYRAITDAIIEEFNVRVAKTTQSYMCNPALRVTENERGRRRYVANRKSLLAQARERHQKHKREALLIISDGNPVCVVCGCPHINALTIGHFNNDGAEHRKEIGGSSSQLMRWVLYAPIDEVRARVRVECFYCNDFHAKNKRYPSEDEMPAW